MINFLKISKNLMLVLAILNVLGVLLVLTTPFGGMTVGTYYGLRDRYTSLGSGYSDLYDNIIIVLLALSMLATAFIAFLGRAGQFSNLKRLKTGLSFSLLVTGLAIVGGVYFEISRAMSDYYDWWQDTGFFASLIVGLLSSVVFLLLLKKSPALKLTE